MWPELFLTSARLAVSSLPLPSRYSLRTAATQNSNEPCSGGADDPAQSSLTLTRRTLSLRVITGQSPLETTAAEATQAGRTVLEKAVWSGGSRGSAGSVEDRRQSAPPARRVGEPTADLLAPRAYLLQTILRAANRPVTRPPCFRELPSPLPHLALTFSCRSGLPISSPSSYSADTSFLQRRQQQQSTSPSASSSSSAHVPDEERGRRRTRRSSKRSSGGSVYSIGGSRLSPTQEVDSDDDEDTETEREETDEDEAYQGPVVPLSYKQALLNPPSALPPPPHHRPTTESTPLLSSFSTSPPGLELDVPGPSAARRELGILLGYTLPICGTHFLEYSLLVVTVVSVGHIGTVELAAASLASMTSNVVALSVIQVRAMFAEGRHAGW